MSSSTPKVVLRVKRSRGDAQIDQIIVEDQNKRPRLFVLTSRPFPSTTDNNNNNDNGEKRRVSAKATPFSLSREKRANEIISERAKISRQSAISSLRFVEDTIEVEVDTRKTAVTMNGVEMEREKIDNDNEMITEFFEERDMTEASANTQTLHIESFNELVSLCELDEYDKVGDGVDEDSNDEDHPNNDYPDDPDDPDEDDEDDEDEFDEDDKDNYNNNDEFDEDEDSSDPFSSPSSKRKQRGVYGYRERGGSSGSDYDQAAYDEEEDRKYKEYMEKYKFHGTTDLSDDDDDVDERFSPQKKVDAMTVAFDEMDLIDISGEKEEL